MSDGITDAYKKVSKEEELKMDVRYINGLISELQKAVKALEQRLEDK